MISRVSKDELVSTLVAASTVGSSERHSAVNNQLNNEDDDNDDVFEEAHRTKDATGSGVETFRKLLEEIDKAPKQLESTRRYYTVYEFLDINDNAQSPDSMTSDKA